METHKRIYNKLADKVELASEKIELGALDMLKAGIKNLKNAEKDADKVVTKYESKHSEMVKAYREVMQERNAIYSWVSDAKLYVQDVEKITKELGINVESIPEVKEFNKLVQTGKELIKVLDDLGKPNKI